MLFNEIDILLNIYARARERVIVFLYIDICSEHFRVITVLRITTSYPAVKFRHYSQRHVLYVYNETGDVESITRGKCVSPK